MPSRGEPDEQWLVSHVCAVVVLTDRVRGLSETCVAVVADSLPHVHGGDGTGKLTGISADMLSSQPSLLPEFQRWS